METISYQLTTKSSLIISPRDSLAFYKELKEFSPQQVKDDSNYLMVNKLKVIYPFYQYGMYTQYNPDSAEYYLPGSSVKGALCQGSAASTTLMVDDIEIPNEDIVLRNLYKVQYLNDDKNACFKPFFDHVGVEMVRAGASLEGEFNLDGTEQAKTLLTAANELTRIKMRQMKEYLCELEKGDYRQGLSEYFRQTVEKLSSLLDDGNIFLLGGYKGLLHSMEVRGALLDTAGAVFLDPETGLPHGLVTIELQ